MKETTLRSKPRSRVVARKLGAHLCPGNQPDCQYLVDYCKKRNLAYKTWNSEEIVYLSESIIKLENNSHTLICDEANIQILVANLAPLEFTVLPSPVSST